MGKSKRKKNEPSTKTKEITETIDQKAIKIFSTDGLIQYIDDDRWSVRSKPDASKWRLVRIAFRVNAITILSVPVLGVSTLQQ